MADFHRYATAVTQLKLNHHLIISALALFFGFIGVANDRILSLMFFSPFYGFLLFELMKIFRGKISKTSLINATGLIFFTFLAFNSEIRSNILYKTHNQEFELSQDFYFFDSDSRIIYPHLRHGQDKQKLKAGTRIKVKTYRKYASLEHKILDIENNAVFGSILEGNFPRFAAEYLNLQAVLNERSGSFQYRDNRFARLIRIANLALIPGFIFFSILCFDYYTSSNQFSENHTRPQLAFAIIVEFLLYFIPGLVLFATAINDGLTSFYFGIPYAYFCIYIAWTTPGRDYRRFIAGALLMMWFGLIVLDQGRFTFFYSIVGKELTLKKDLHITHGSGFVGLIQPQFDERMSTLRPNYIFRKGDAIEVHRVHKLGFHDLARSYLIQVKTPGQEFEVHSRSDPYITPEFQRFSLDYGYLEDRFLVQLTRNGYLDYYSITSKLYLSTYVILLHYYLVASSLFAACLIIRLRREDLFSQLKRD